MDELLVAATTEAGLIYRLIVRQQLRNLRDCRAEGLGTLLTPEDRNSENFRGFDKDLNVLKQGIAVGHQHRELALDVNDYKGAVFNIEHLLFAADDNDSQKYFLLCFGSSGDFCNRFLVRSQDGLWYGY